MASGSSADTAMTFVGGEVAAPAAGESTADDPPSISVDSATTEEEKKQKPSASSSSRRPRPRARSAPKTLSQTRSASASTRTKAGERRPCKTVMQCLQTTTRTKDREPRSPEQMKLRSSSRSTSRKASRKKSQPPMPLARQLATDPAPMSLTRDQAMSTPSDNDTADLLLDRAFRQQEATRHKRPVLSRTSRPRAVNSQIIEQLKHAEEEMRIFHQQDLQRHEAIERAMTKKVALRR